MMVSVFVQQIRRKSQVPIIMQPLLLMKRIGDRLELGADDYIAKPFSPVN